MGNTAQSIKQKISDGMKKAHAEGRAHNIGQSRWNNTPSYPEQWFMQVIENEFSDKNYKREFPFFQYSLDFAWPDKKFCVEIDGEQHYRNNEAGKKQQERDQKKDQLLKENGWYEIRVPWKTICLSSKEFIQFVKTALDSAVVQDITNEPWFLTKRIYKCPICGKEVSSGKVTCPDCAAKRRRRSTRPDKIELARELYQNSFTELGRIYGISANAIIKWCKFYGLPTHIFELRNWYRLNILNLPEMQKPSKKLVSPVHLKIYQCDKITHEVINTFDSYSTAARCCNISKDNISRVCRGLRKTAGGYFWKSDKV